MTERENYRESNPNATPVRREIYQETVADTTGAPTDASRHVYQERVVGPAGDQVVRAEHVRAPSEATQRAASVTRIKQVVYFIFGVINVLLAIRFVLLLLGANEASPFVNLIYSVSRPFVLPFQGIFGEPVFNGSVIEWSSLIGIVVYMLIAYAIARVIELMYAPTRPTVTPDV